MRSGRIKVLAVAALFLLAMAACSDDDPGNGTSPPTESSAPSEEPSEEPAEATVAVEDSDSRADRRGCRGPHAVRVPRR